MSGGLLGVFRSGCLRLLLALTLAPFVVPFIPVLRLLEYRCCARVEL